MRMAILGLAIGLAACAHDRGEAGEPVTLPRAGAGDCEASALLPLRGQPATAELARRVLSESGARALRWIGPDSAVTMDYRTDRVNIEFDRQNRVTGIRCG